ADSSKVYGADDPAFEKATITEYVGEDLDGIDLSVSRTDAGDDTLGKHEGVLAIGQTAEQLNAAYTNYNFAVDTGDFTISE
ncbi:MBG domain-containing protein, partial [Collinsella intestinalis]|uniref:MBG domain-containing protein n=1 Tax=Collinsella intestinalis TaxID=147207 RepID=UPI00195BE0E8